MRLLRILRPHRLPLPLRLSMLIAAAALAPAAAAEAATYCVMKPACAGTTKPSVQEALDAALLAGPDRIEIGSTAGQLPLAGGTYLSTDPLEIQGMGRAVTQLGGSGSVLSIGLGSSSSSVIVSDLGIVMQPGSGGTGLRLDGARAQRVDLSSDPSATSPVGVELLNGAAFQQGRVSLPNPNAVGIWTRVGTSRVDDSVVSLGNASGARALLAENPGGQTPVILDAQHVTVAGASSGQIGAAASSAASGQTVVLNIRNSILSGVGHALSRSAPSGSVNINAIYSNYDPAGNIDSGGVGGITSSSTTALDPMFLDAAGGDFRLPAGSPLIDAAQPGNLEPGEPSSDIAGTKRILDGNRDCSPRRDIGAFELLPGNASARASATPGAALINQRITFDASTSCDPDPLAGISAYSWSFDDGRTATGAVVPHSFARPGVHSATLTVTSSAGRRGSTTVTATVANPPRTTGLPRSRAKRRSLVLIQARAVRLSSGGLALIQLRCAGARRCTGRLELTAPRPASKSAGRLIVKLGSARFSIRGHRAKKVRIRLSSARLRFVKELKRVRAIAIVRDRDSAGRPRRSTRPIILKAPRR